jgi:hypothetical protein
LYANFSLSAFPLCGEEKWPPENKNGGKRISLYDVDALLFPPSMLFCFSTLVQNISRKRRRYILSRRTFFFFFSQRSRRRRLSFVTAPGGVVVVVTAAFFLKEIFI